MAKAHHSIYVVDGPKIRQLRDRAGWSLNRFAKALGTDTTHMSRIERGKGQPSPELRNRIANLLRVEIEEIATLREPTGA